MSYVIIYHSLSINCHRGLRVGGHSLENQLLTGGLMFLRLFIELSAK